jgi:pimeloyl-ACP methyl ester carboxylesterase
VVIAPAWSEDHQSAYGYSPREHHAVLASLREAVRRFSIDTDRVFLSGHSLGGDAAWDVALAHPDLWAGLVMIGPTAGRYVTHYWPNARSLPIYAVAGELDRATVQRDATDLDRYFSKGFDATYVEYRGRGHEHFSDELLRLFDWMGRKRRSFFPKEFEAVTMRPWDRFFWWVELEGLPPKTIVVPEQWPPAAGVRPFQIEAKAGATNTLSVRCGADRVKVWLAPELIDFTRPATVTVDGQRLLKVQPVPDARGSSVAGRPPASILGGRRNRSRPSTVTGEANAKRKAHRLTTCATGDSEGLPVLREPALLTSAAMDGGAKSASSE